MKLNEIQDNDGAKTNRKRVGRGIGSGTGKTAGRGHKGQKSRSGVSIKGFEGGQMPINRRLPKRGFTNGNRVEYSTINTCDLQRAIEAKRIKVGASLNEADLVALGLTRGSVNGVKLLAKGALTSKITLEVTKVSEAAKALVEKAGGSISLREVAEKPKTHKAAMRAQKEQK